MRGRNCVKPLVNNFEQSTRPDIYLINTLYIYIYILKLISVDTYSTDINFLSSYIVLNNKVFYATTYVKYNKE